MGGEQPLQVTIQTDLTCCERVNLASIFHFFIIYIESHAERLDVSWDWLCRGPTVFQLLSGASTALEMVIIYICCDLY